MIASFQRQLTDFFGLLGDKPALAGELIIRLLIALAIELAFEAFMAFVIGPALLATGIGIFAEGLALCFESAFQPAINSIVFISFDDRFLHASLKHAGILDKLEQKYGPTHLMTLLERYSIRYVVKFCVDSCIGFVGLTTLIPVVGNLITAFAIGWAVAWDYVYVALNGIGYTEPHQQLDSVYKNFKSYYRWGVFWVLIEELPFVGPFLHAWNIHTAAYFLEEVYVDKRQDHPLMGVADMYYNNLQ